MAAFASRLKSARSMDGNSDGVRASSRLWREPPRLVTGPAPCGRCGRTDRLHPRSAPGSHPQLFRFAGPKTRATLPAAAVLPPVFHAARQSSASVAACSPFHALSCACFCVRRRGRSHAQLCRRLRPCESFLFGFSMCRELSVAWAFQVRLRLCSGRAVSCAHREHNRYKQGDCDPHHKGVCGELQAFSV